MWHTENLPQGGILGPSTGHRGWCRPRVQLWVYCVGSARIIGEEWNVVTFTSLLSCHVVERQYQNALERLAPCFEFHQAIQCNNGSSNWPCPLGSPALNSWEPRLSHWPPGPGLKLQRQTIKVLVIFKHCTQFSLLLKKWSIHFSLLLRMDQTVWVATIYFYMTFFFSSKFIENISELIINRILIIKRMSNQFKWIKPDWFINIFRNNSALWNVFKKFCIVFQFLWILWFMI